MKTAVSSRTKTKLFIDIVIFAGFLVAWDPNSTGIAVHEWLTIGGIAALVVHLLLSWNWIVEIGVRFFGVLPPRTRFSYILNLLLFVDMTLIMFTGIMISRAVMPFLHIPVQHNPLWRGMHDATANIFCAVAGRAPRAALGLDRTHQQALSNRADRCTAGQRPTTGAAPGSQAMKLMARVFAILVAALSVVGVALALATALGVGRAVLMWKRAPRVREMPGLSPKVP